MSLEDIRLDLKKLADPKIAEQSQRFFKTNVGEYGEGDIFLGIKVPVIRKEVKKYKNESFNTIIDILNSKYHEERLFALIWLVERFKKTNEEERALIYKYYLENINFVNNWDLVDSSAHYILGPYLEKKDKDLLYEFSKSENLWKRRISIMTTFHFIKNENYNDALNISEILLNDTEDLIQKAVGWMLREIGNRDNETEVKFLQKHYKGMPRTMLRYAIEKFSKEERQKYLKGLI